MSEESAGRTAAIREAYRRGAGGYQALAARFGVSRSTVRSYIAAERQKQREEAVTARPIWCCACKSEVRARLTDGIEVYPHLPEFGALPFWRCDGCGGTVGCHHKTADRTRPLGVIADAEMKLARRHIHRRLDPLWTDGRAKRKTLYARLTHVLGREYHTAELRTLDEARAIYREVLAIERELVGERVRHGC